MAGSLSWTSERGAPVSQPVSPDFPSSDATYSGRLIPISVGADADGLSDGEGALVASLSQQIGAQQSQLLLLDSYYRGQMRVRDLGISIPEKMRSFKVALGWPRVGVDALEVRLNVQGFRYQDATDVDQDLARIWQANSMDAESRMVHLDALVFGRGFVSVGSPESGDVPIISVESPLDIAVSVDPRTRAVRAALRVYGDATAQQATLYLPDQTVYLASGPSGWVVVERDTHNLGQVPIVRFANRSRSYNLDGSSEITTEIMSITDEACRTLQALAVAREFYSAPQRYILGASESAFQNADGSPRSGWQTYQGAVLALEANEAGDVPTVGQFTAYDPSVFTNVIDMYAKIMSSLTAVPPHVLGYTTDNPASADAIRSTDMSLAARAEAKTQSFGDPWRRVMALAAAIADGGAIPDPSQIVTDWADTSIPTPAATTDAVVKQVMAGIVPATSDVTLAELGYGPTDRQRLEQDRGASNLDEIRKALTPTTQAQINAVGSGDSAAAGD